MRSPTWPPLHTSGCGVPEEVGVGECLTTLLVKSDWCPQPPQLLRRDEGEQVMQIGLEAACWHLTSGMVIKNTLWQRQHLVVRSERQPNSSVVQRYPCRTCTGDERCPAKPLNTKLRFKQWQMKNKRSLELKSHFHCLMMLWANWK